ncbi:Dual specificity phosphatase, catalytic domain [Novipirellula galeiformis]|uniref:Dual specificity phosphatase, catalytic domain n=1 Tax=Novipirellula galeiformis TaxID=2528004 RepID=A0A5C6CGY1_9BACT|nr:dual specificity protein phosphatase [Novipirellula galeiformis]TWU22506.1 Dual specificity phosphatase, catalytic domain [Novipirellula galeiformis]
MQEIEVGQLWVGHAMDTRDPHSLFDLGIRAVVDLAYEEPPTPLPRQLIYCRFPILDGAGNDAIVLQLALQTIVDLLRSGHRTLVACSAGMSRSPTLTAFALATFRGETPEAVLQRIAASRALEVKGPLWNEVAALFSKIR